MKNKLMDLNNHLFEQLERLNDEELKGDGLETEMNRAKAIAKLAQSIINNGDLMLRAHKQYTEYGSSIPTVLALENGEKK